LLDQSWPAGLANDVSNVYETTSPLMTELATATESTLPESTTTWTIKTLTDFVALIGEVNVVNNALGLPSFETGSSAEDACEADGAEVVVALAVFRAQNPGVAPTETTLTGKTNRGPFIAGWPHSSRFAYFLFSGQLRIAAPPQVASVPHRGVSSCEAAGV
jgi:hypothetical protein